MKNWHICALPLAGTVDLCNRLSSMLSLQTDVISLVKNQLKYNDCSTFVVFHIMVAAILIWQKNTNWWQNSSIMIKDTLMMSIEIFNLCPFLWSLQLLCCDYLSRLRNVFIYCFFCFFLPPSRWRHERLPFAHRNKHRNQSKDWYSQGRGGKLCQRFPNAWIWQSLNKMKMKILDIKYYFSSSTPLPVTRVTPLIYGEVSYWSLSGVEKF